ncbi:AAA family ATPase [Mycolicibacterium fortuitum]|uniref:AAA family ATPase n=1 Tax=Mycolicibacterium fortuitum TaxID=1766 RepID=UPI001130A981|nr:AAA family ATPase [Mycolicibacterium fortuitum]TPW97571.1 AAA family ATPase [Mycolicibacterium fortuitum]UBV19840.1 AAA family ATPase [Mycolicibacterium fortuitum]
MKLEAFRVQNYKRVENTDWVSCGDLTVLVGKNEAGKSAILRGLSKLNPSDGEEYDGLREFPRRRYTDEFDPEDPADVASARFSLTEDEQAELGDISPLVAGAKAVEVTKHYGNKFTVRFDPHPGPDRLRSSDVKPTVTAALDVFAESFAPDGHGDEFGPLKSELTEQLTVLADALPSSLKWVSVETVEAFYTAVSAKLTEEWHKTALAGLLDVFRPLRDEARERAALGKARSWAVDNMPQFIYFDHYDVLDSAVHIPTFMTQLRDDQHAPRVRTTRALFRHVNLDPQQLHQLNGDDSNVSQEEMRRRVDERAILTSSAGQAMTEKFSKWWLQRRHTFRYDLDGNYFRVWVADDLDPSEIELDQRSQGMQYFFSFFLIFLVEAVDTHRNSILLLDEPGNSLHGTAQAKIIEFLRSISDDNQVIYTTHSPFMIDGDHLEEIRPVWEDRETGSTKVSEDVWPKDKDALFPLQAALGYQLAQSLFISRYQVLVEGITDMWIVKALDAALPVTGRAGLRDGIIITPGGGAGRVLPLASMLVGHEVQAAALLDGDEPGRKEGRKVERVLGYDNRVLFVGDFTPDGNTTGEIEDLFPDDYFMAAVKEAYPGKDLRFNADEKAVPNIVDRLEALFERKGHGVFEKWKVARVLADNIMADPSKVPTDVLDAFERIAVALNAITDSS